MYEPDNRELKYSEKNMSQCHSVHHKCLFIWSRFETGPSRWEAGNSSRDLRLRGRKPATSRLSCRMAWRYDLNFTVLSASCKQKRISYMELCLGVKYHGLQEYTNW